MLILPLAACASPAPRGSDPVVELLIEARRGVSAGGPADLRRTILDRCDNLTRGHAPGFRSRQPYGYDMGQGEIRATGRSLDFAIEGDGFFAVTMPDSTIRYTRCGQWTLDEQGNITVSGNLLQPPIAVPENATRVIVDSTGFLQGFDPTQADTLQSLGQITLARFINPEALGSQDGILFCETVGSGQPLIGEPGQNGFGLIRQGSLEESNVRRMDEALRLAEEVRAFRIACEAAALRSRLRTKD